MRRRSGRGERSTSATVQLQANQRGRLVARDAERFRAIRRKLNTAQRGSESATTAILLHPGQTHTIAVQGINDFSTLCPGQDKAVSAGASCLPVQPLGWIG